MTASEYIVAGIGGLAFIAWAVAAGSWLMAIRHRAEGVSLSTLLFQGFKAFDPDSFDETGRVHQKRFLRAFAVFFLLVFLGVGVGAISSIG